jgi:hypothetical protein
MEKRRSGCGWVEWREMMIVGIERYDRPDGETARQDKRRKGEN